MQYVLNLGSFLYWVNRALKPGGIAAIRVPYRELLLLYSPHMSYSNAFGHFRTFNKGTMHTYIEEAGFSVQLFHLDAFSPGSPQPYPYNSDRRKASCHKLLRVINRFLEDLSDATLCNEHLLV